MKNNLFFILTLLTTHTAPAQAHAGLEQYYCPGSTLSMAPVTRVWYGNTGKSYIEARYNYDAAESIGLSIGKQFGAEKAKDMGWTLTPTAGVVAGKCQGISLGLNIGLHFHDWNFSSAAQLTPVKGNGYSYSWSELGRAIGRNFYLGTALQQDCRFGLGCTLSPGLTVQLSLAGWTFPLYVFNPLDKHVWLMTGLTHEWVFHKSIDHSKNYPQRP